MLDNLLDNGLRHIPPDGGEVTLGLHKTPQWVSFEVCDTGCGIAPEDVPHVFDRFFQQTDRNPAE